MAEPNIAERGPGKPWTHCIRCAAWTFLEPTVRDGTPGHEWPPGWTHHIAIGSLCPDCSPKGPTPPKGGTKVTRARGDEGVCPTCGSMTQPTGTCWACPSCGWSGGC